MSNLPRNFLLILACAGAGALSGFLSRPYLLRGALFGAVLACGIVALNPWDRPCPPVSKPSVTRLRALVTALVVSVVAFALMAVLERGRSPEQLLHPASPLATSLTLSTLLLLGYRRRHLGKRPTFYWLLLAPVLGAVVRASGNTVTIESMDLNFGNRVMLFILYGTYPFVLLFLLAVRSFDPAWTRDRWFRNEDNHGN